jgi:hypothetical protein
MCGAEQILDAYLTFGKNICRERDIRMEFPWNIFLVPCWKTGLRLTYRKQWVFQFGGFSWRKENLCEYKFRPSVCNVASATKLSEDFREIRHRNFLKGLSGTPQFTEHWFSHSNTLHKGGAQRKLWPLHSSWKILVKFGREYFHVMLLKFGEFLKKKCALKPILYLMA